MTIVGCVESSERTAIEANIPTAVRSEDFTHLTSTLTGTSINGVPTTVALSNINRMFLSNMLFDPLLPRKSGAGESHTAMNTASPRTPKQWHSSLVYRIKPGHPVYKSYFRLKPVTH